MTHTAANIKLSGWGRMSPSECHVYRPESRAGLHDLIQHPPHATIIPRGLGRSYGDAAVNGGESVLDLTRLNRMLAFDAETGLLECEAGVSLAEIIEAFLPVDFSPVSPGTKFVTVGGAIANDIHGKNHHCVGSFGEFVRELTLLTPAGGVLTCSPDSNTEIFWATVGGIGLTGLILSAKFELKRVESAYVSVDYQRTQDLDGLLAAMAESDEDYHYSVAWVDCLAKGKNVGRSVLMRGNHAPASRLQGAQASHPFSMKVNEKSMPVDLPGFALNPLSIKAFNTLFYARHPNRQGVLVDIERYFYPLDSIHHWNRMYGKRGFAQYQATFPKDGLPGMVTVLERLSQERRASFLAVLKSMGPGSGGLLSHPIEGYTLNLDLPNSSGLEAFLHEMDRILLDHGGRLYFAKDAVARPETIAAMYPRLDEFRAIKAQVNPAGRLSSNLARRLRIVEDAPHG